MRVNWPNSLAYVTYKRTYARPLEGRTEEYPETMERIFKAFRDQLKVGFSEEEERRLLFYYSNFKASVAGRFLWQLGTETVNRLGLPSLQNCAFTVIDHPITPFCWTMDMLALGSGVGFNIQRKHVSKIPPVKTWFKTPQRVDHGGADFIIPDSREGWVKFLGKTLKAAFLSDSPAKGTFTYSTQVIRGKGTPIKGFGGVASGPEDLCKGIDQISEILRKRKGRQLRPIDALDILNIIGSIIVAGNVRRSAQVALGDPDDVEFILAKRWDMGAIPAWRAMSNNSVVVDDLKDLHEYFWDGYLGKGEPYGLINMRLSRSCGRLNETEYPDLRAEGYNPCCEQTLEPFETCCLSEIFLPNINSLEEFLDVAELSYRVNKHSLLLPAPHQQTESVVHRNMRMGIGVTGIMQATAEQLGWLDDCYKYLREFDEEYSKKLGVPTSIKLTTVKPSGTLSLLAGVTPGAHPGYARYMIRRIRVSSSHNLVDICKKKGYPIEYALQLDGAADYGTSVISFPLSYPENTKIAAETTAIEQLEVIRFLQTNWSDNSVSCTVYYRPEELPAIQEYLKKHYRDNFKSLSFLLHRDHGFKQAPYEEISEEEYQKLLSRVKSLHSLNEVEEDVYDADCIGGACPVK